VVVATAGSGARSAIDRAQAGQHGQPVALHSCRTLDVGSRLGLLGWGTACSGHEQPPFEPTKRATPYVRFAALAIGYLP
jgi:hypothetical protein